MKRLNRESRVECPTCAVKFYTQLACTKHRMRVHGYVPYPTRRQLQALMRERGIPSVTTFAAGVFRRTE